MVRKHSAAGVDLSSIRHCSKKEALAFEKDRREDINAFLEKRPPPFQEQKMINVNQEYILN